MNVWRAWLILTASVLAVLGTTSSLALAATKNIVVVVADDLGLTLGCYGDRVARTPHLDQLAAEGTLFTHAFCTTASCSPSRSVILTGIFNHANGQYGLQHGTHHFSTLDRITSLPARLSKAGYRTARIGKFHVAPESVYPFDAELPGNPRNSVQMAERCREFVTSDDPRPFFLYFCSTDPHRSGQTGPPPHEPNLFGNEGNYPGSAAVTFDPQKIVVPPFLPDTAACRAELAEYYQSAARFDQGVGKLVEVLKAAGHWDDTLFVFLSDNGVPFPGAKTTVYEPGLRLPLIVRNPLDKARGQQSAALVSWVDLTPTILEFAGAPRDKQLQGRSFLAEVDGRGGPPTDEVYASHTFHEVTMYYPMRVVRTRKHKLIWNLAHGLVYPSAADLWHSATWQEALAKGPSSTYGKRTVTQYLGRPEWELYDLDADPDETKNLAADSEHAATLALLKEKLRAFQERTKDPWLHKWQYE